MISDVRCQQVQTPGRAEGVKEVEEAPGYEGLGGSVGSLSRKNVLGTGN